MLATSAHPRSFRPVEAFRALHRLLRDPDDTEQAFRLVRSLDGHGVERIRRRLSRTEEGRALLRDRPSLLEALSDQQALEALPEGSLGRAYLDFCRAEGITPGGLVEAADAGWGDDEVEDEELAWIAERMRDSHDLWHLVNGYRTDLLGELCVLTFTFAQTHNAGLGVLVTAGYLRSFTFWDFGPRGRAMARHALARGRRAEWLPAVRWEDLLDQPLEAVRFRLGVGAPPEYEPLRAADVGLGAAS